MFGIAEFIVGLLFLPVTLFIIIPLIMLIGWTIASVFATHKISSEATEE